VAVDQLSDSVNMYDVAVNQEFHLSPADGPFRSYELCVQAGSAKAGTKLRFAADGGTPFYTVPGMQERHIMELEVGLLSTQCFRFALDPTLKNYNGRVSLEMGSTQTHISICQVSLRSCRQTSNIPGGLEPVRRCYVSPLEAVSGTSCEKEADVAGEEYELNNYAQETSGKQACHRQMRSLGVNTFVFTPGRCQLWNCGTRDALLASAIGTTDMQVYSTQCDYQENAAGKNGMVRRNPVFIKLWEWNFVDIARECEAWIGPNGFDAIQIAPVTDHIVNGSWHAKYQPVSFLLNSRSGTAAEFKCMVATCRAAGVEVMVDVVLNHLARPCDAVGSYGAGAVTPCVGWGGSRYGNRRVAEEPGWQPIGPASFHHFLGDRLINCAVDSETFQCPDSTPPGDCTQCDLFGLPDFDTSSRPVQELLTKHLKELHTLGVTMLRLDAASYMPAKDLSLIINELPWDFVFQEWWAGVPAPSRSRYVGHYRDIFFGRKINAALVLNDVNHLSRLLNITNGLDGMSSQQVLHPLTFHDQRSYDYQPNTPTYKGGLEFHLQQKFFLASPYGHLVRVWGGYGWKNLDDGPPGCSHLDERCVVEPVYNPDGSDRCLPTPVSTPLPDNVRMTHRWVCEHRWQGVAGLVDYRKHCNGKMVTKLWDGDVEHGNLAWRAGSDCFVALQRKMPPRDAALGDWSIVGLVTGLPAGRYCDLSSLSTFKDWNGAGCEREVVLGANGVVIEGVVPEGDMLAIHTEAQIDPTSRAASRQPRSITQGQSLVCHASGGHTAQDMQDDDDDSPIGSSVHLRAPLWAAYWIGATALLTASLQP